MTAVAILGRNTQKTLFNFNKMTMLELNMQSESFSYVGLISTKSLHCQNVMLRHQDHFVLSVAWVQPLIFSTVSFIFTISPTWRWAQSGKCIFSALWLMHQNDMESMTSAFLDAAALENNRRACLDAYKHVEKSVVATALGPLLGQMLKSRSETAFRFREQLQSLRRKIQL